MNANGTGHACDPRDTRHAAAKLLSLDCSGNDGEWIGNQCKEPVDRMGAAIAASLLARDPARLAALADAADPTEQLDDGSLLRVTRIRTGFRIEHVIRSGSAPPEQVWEVDAADALYRKARDAREKAGGA
jgi:hypothetical protein